MFRTLRARLARFLAGSDGSMSAELVIILPVLMAWVAMSLVFYDGYHQRVVNQKAAYTLSDLISRELDDPVGPKYINGLDKVFDFLTGQASSDGGIRVTVVYCKDNCSAGASGRELTVDWSYSTSSTHSALTSSDINGSYLDEIPLAAKGDRQILVETYLEFQPILDIGLRDDIVMEMFVVTRPRFVPQLVWDSNA